MRMVFLLTMLLLSMSARSEGWSCWHEAAQRYDLPPSLLYAIAHVESGNRTNAINRNPDGSYDLGVMQINSRHLKWLSKHGITAKDLLENPCLNVQVGAYILRESIDRYGWTWRGIGAYNAKSDHKRMAYARKVIHTHKRLFRD